ncbi:hypothetical protein AAIR98_001452 [Elusimicrobium simillimum]|uniref:hypothetical protein n=1 Tax=Elusimicrobium simillimum TaxID=3143438 RepID=UPI003C6F9B69
MQNTEITKTAINDAIEKLGTLRHALCGDSFPDHTDYILEVIEIMGQFLAGLEKGLYAKKDE